MPSRTDLPAGPFSCWLDRTRIVLADDGDADVPCGECNSCCRSSFFIHVRPEETETLAHVPSELLFPAPGLPSGNVLMGYDESGCCPMLAQGACSIYEYRPLTCRAFDCRVFSAAEIASGRPLIDEHARRWTFSHPAEQDRALHDSVRAAAQFLQRHPACFPAEKAPGNPALVAITAIKVCDVFAQAGTEPDDGGAHERSSARVIEKVVDARKRFDARCGGTSSAGGGSPR